MSRVFTGEPRSPQPVNGRASSEVFVRTPRPTLFLNQRPRVADNYAAEEKGEEPDAIEYPVWTFLLFSILFIACISIAFYVAFSEASVGKVSAAPLSESVASLTFVVTETHGQQRIPLDPLSGDSISMYEVCCRNPKGVLRCGLSESGFVSNDNFAFILSDERHLGSECTLYVWSNKISEEYTMTRALFA